MSLVLTGSASESSGSGGGSGFGCGTVKLDDNTYRMWNICVGNCGVITAVSVFQIAVSNFEALT